MSKHTNLLSLIQTGYHTVEVTFDFALPAITRRYTYKTTDASLKEGDFVVVDTPSGGYKVAMVTEVHTHAKIDPDVSYHYKWIVCRVDDSFYKDTLEREEKARRLLLELERQKKRSEMLAQFESSLQDGPTRQIYDELKNLLDSPAKANPPLEHK